MNRLDTLPSMTAPSPLGVMPARDQGVIVALDGGRSLVSRLAALGFVPGAPVSMVQNFGRGPLIVLIRQTRIALGRNEAMRISVRKGAS